MLYTNRLNTIFIPFIFGVGFGYTDFRRENKNLQLKYNFKLEEEKTKNFVYIEQEKKYKTDLEIYKKFIESNGLSSYEYNKFRNKLLNFEHHRGPEEHQPSGIANLW
jgi:hypothetical protein